MELRIKKVIRNCAYFINYFVLTLPFESLSVIFILKHTVDELGPVASYDYGSCSIEKFLSL
jgi:hypothetical protein